MDFQDMIIALVKSGLTAEPAALPDEADWNAVFLLASMHQIAPLLYSGMRYSSASAPPQCMQCFKAAVYACALSDEKQAKAFAQLSEAFEAAGVDYLPLKGINLKPLYPDSLLRVMSDLDIMIRVEQYGEIREIMTQLGFSEGEESDHELVWHGGGVKIELHKRLIPSYNADYYAYYGDGWKLAKPVGASHRHCLGANDELIYIFTHFAKHYRDGGIGIRHLVDLYVYLNAGKPLDSWYIKEQLLQLRLFDFYCNIRRTVDAWFSCAAADEIVQFITARIFSSGSYGLDTEKAIASAVRESKNHSSAAATRRRRALDVFFPPRRSLALRYPALERAPILLPLFWAVRFFDVLAHRRGDIRRAQKRIGLATDDNIRRYQAELDLVGLDFPFKH